MVSPLQFHKKGPTAPKMKTNLLDSFAKRVALLLLLTGAVCIPVIATVKVPPAAAAAATAPTMVSLTFDDSDADQVQAEQTMKANGLTGTFYTVSGWVGAPGYLSRTDLSRIAADGNEIGGHTITHPDLIQINPSEAQRQICNDRATLDSWGYRPVNFAYPFSDANPQVEALAKGCGYNTARGLGDVRSPSSCAGCAFAEATPPADPYYLKAPDQVDSSWTLAQMKTEVTQAATRQGGWVILTFHHVCAPIGTASCQADQSTTPTIFNAFVKWLADYSKQAANKTSVKTVDQVVRQYSGTNYPAYVTPKAVPNSAPAADGVNALSNPSLETRDASTGFPTCFQPGGWGTNTATWTASTAAHTGTGAEQLDVTGYQSGDAKLLPALDLGACSPTVVAGQTYDLSTWYTSTGTTQFALYYRDASGAWFYWTSSPWFAKASTWTQAKFTTPAVPANAVAMTFGLALISNGTLTTDDYSLVHPAAAPAGASTASAATPARTPAAAPAAGATARMSAKRPHSRLRPFLPDGSGVKPNQRIAVPELGSVAKVGKG